MYIYDVVENRNVYANAGVEKILGFNTKEIQEMGEQLFSTLIHPDDIQSVKGHHEQLKESVEGDVFHIDYRMKKQEWRISDLKELGHGVQKNRRWRGAADYRTGCGCN